MAQKGGELGNGETRIERDPHQPGGHGGVIGLEVFPYVRHEECDPLALAQPKPEERFGEAEDGLRDVLIGPGARVIHNGRALAMSPSKRAPLRADMGLRLLHSPALEYDTPGDRAWRGLRPPSGTAARSRCRA